MTDFYADTLKRLLQKNLVHQRMKVLAVCGGEKDKKALEQTGFHDVTISNLDVRMKGKEFAPFAWSLQDAENLAFKDGEFDFCIIHDGLHHCQSPPRALTEPYRVAKNGLLVFEPRDSLSSRLARILNFAQDYEVSGISWNDYSFGGVKNTEIPNFVYRWTEQEVKKTIASFAPWGHHRFLFFYCLRIPWMRLRALKNKFWLAAAIAGFPFLKLLTLIFPRQCNNFAFAVFKPEVPRDLQPWIEFREDTPRIKKTWFQARYR